jgi:hypothetical protein
MAGRPIGSVGVSRVRTRFRLARVRKIFARSVPLSELVKVSSRRVHSRKSHPWSSAGRKPSPAARSIMAAPAAAGSSGNSPTSPSNSGSSARFGDGPSSGSRGSSVEPGEPSRR